MRSASRIPTVALALFSTVVLGACDASAVRRPMRRSEEYRNSVAAYKTATVVVDLVVAPEDMPPRPER